MRKYIDEARAKGATPILLTTTVRNIWTDGRIERDMGYNDFIQQIAATEKVEYVDMATIAADNFEKLGPEKTALLFPIDHTHTNAEGAESNAQSVASALRMDHSPAARYLK
jgi:lysophospholipase L1-like esterase